MSDVKDDIKMTNVKTLINILTLNCWGIPYVSQNRNVRMTAIAEKFATENYDIICLQEVWSVKDFKMIRAKTEEQLPYSHYFYSGVLGSGICILSRFPIKDVIFHKWPLNGYVHKIHHGDWFGGKGVGLCRLQIHNMNINVYIAHLHAEYNNHSNEYTAHRVLQAFDTAQFIRMTSGGADSVILGGDLNAEPQDLAYKIICGVAGLADACSNISSNLGTNECANNSYTSSKLARTCPEGKRIDHILYQGSKNIKIEVTNFQHPFPKRIPYKDFSYSDHEAIMATFKFIPGEFQTINVDVKDSIKEAISICETSLKTVRRRRFWYLLVGCILIIPLVWSMGLDCSFTSLDVTIGLNVIRIFLTAILCYILFMSSLWNSVETNALKAGCLGMEIYLANLNNNLCKK
ncbi:neutral sphingomyelinase [Bombus vancouverensis nearcticus]|uniref:sphingomyelin phosphodiesterase n=1 Tax=Bombus bifarius TaxID=103933 RepID=A0A6P8NKB0_9HYME|nr:putative neutral sphingomyelinase isoform X1 [Bombus vancouverensis nearcticus]XP_033314882.1 putative neutral sphingomyelinase isoform X1 [Bombus bifarius]XP_050496410.1 putative neutral sphingomyelinase isoform X1 [Bombus huntii]XP_050496411.1 putative neutral sphingomyelinase isoform X1 [Bombus huntii]XP_050496412.1 putative neutral sphingomyelinase isoform X1 [Bombus huntii]XP_050496413.1 putative neutral sphingomyelinase isoform X1 [Bombus huntii]